MADPRLPSPIEAVMAGSLMAGSRQLEGILKVTGVSPIFVDGPDPHYNYSNAYEVLLESGKRVRVTVEEQVV